MRSIETIANVSPDGKLTVQLPYDMPPGDYRVVVAIDEAPMIDEFPLESPPLAATTTTEDAWEFFNTLVGMVEVPDD
ncbi:hypothetical protein WA1_11260 [Scytonema hofmannii PCC 7110]|jgi:hypothetical protein|uniref:Uncharacterized protein n=1 Tax=Scytonema hofmannii PCC 7110 TaxID=128403 RepID=A0A139XFE0_9CYAN|nr:hypothetical protein [Scytonema hofmannii]KYC43410.1 hypothetical protein WA1_11260 [Scytonema hofmannii PCC 7110]